MKHASEQQPMKFYCKKVGGVSGEISTRPFDVTFGTPFVDKLEFCWRQIPDFCNRLSIFQHITWKWTLNRDNKFEQTKHSERVDTYDVTRAPCHNQNGRHSDEQYLKSQKATVAISQKDHIEGCPVDEHIAYKMERKTTRKKSCAEKATPIFAIYDDEASADLSTSCQFSAYNYEILHQGFYKSLHRGIICPVVGGRQDPPLSGGSRACLLHLIRAAHSGPIPLSSLENPLCDVPSASRQC
ncbi:conserved hypothetical protein [Trichinella spiralis]|uniref:hypothetical protein n=1 Tax=Trichinella spiralis TaxID=6334 RepID=UPI0001EFC78F|nr:conserved hypothetical protein [Trichinella spiralis]